jgi:hypothetical protein
MSTIPRRRKRTAPPERRTDGQLADEYDRCLSTNEGAYRGS